MKSFLIGLVLALSAFNANAIVVEVVSIPHPVIEPHIVVEPHNASRSAATSHGSEPVFRSSAAGSNEESAVRPATIVPLAHGSNPSGTTSCTANTQAPCAPEKKDIGIGFWAFAALAFLTGLVLALK